MSQSRASAAANRQVQLALDRDVLLALMKESVESLALDAAIRQGSQLGTEPDGLGRLFIGGVG